MSDYLFMLDNHLDAGQTRAVEGIRQLANAAGMNIWLTGGAMRDMLRGAPIRDLDFTVEHDALKIGHALAKNLEGSVVSEDPLKRWIELALPGDVTASVSNARTEHYAKPGGKPQIAPATIHADLARRDFTINAIALSLGRGSRGLLVDPVNGEADLQSRELRLANPYAFFDDPSRLFRLFRFQHALGFTLLPRTEGQLENALLEEYHVSLPAAALVRELRSAVKEGGAPGMIAGLETHGLLRALSPALTGSRVNIAGLARFEEVAHSVLPSGYPGGWLAFLTVLMEKLNAKDRAAAMRTVELTAEETELWKNLEARVKALEAVLGAARAPRPSQIWDALYSATSDEVLLVLYRSAAGAVQDRIQAYYERYLPLSQDVTEDEVLAAGAKPGTAKYDKVWRALIAARLNAKPPKPEAEGTEEVAAPPQVAAVGVGRPRKQPSAV